MTVSSARPLPPGAILTRAAICLACGKGDMIRAFDVACSRYGIDSPVARIIRAGISSGGLAPSSDWGSELATFRGASAEFFALVAGQSVLGRLSGIRKAPFRTKLIAPQSGSSSYWVGAGRAKPTTKMTFGATALDPKKVASLVVVSEELLANSDPRAEDWIRSDLARAASAEIDIALLDPGNSGDVETPQSITYGVSGVTGSGTAATDMAALLSAFQGDLANAFLISSPFAGTQMCNADNPNCGARGGEFKMVPLITSANCPDGLIVLVDVGGVAVASGDVVMKASQQASIEMETDPNDSPPSVGTVSMFQTNSIALLSEIAANWSRMRPEAVSYIHSASWAVPVPLT